MSSEIASPDTPLNTCPAAFLTGQAALIAELHAQAEGARWGVPLSDFAGALYRSAVRHFDGAPPEGDALGIYLRGLHLADLALACALQLGSETAWEDFVVRFRPALYTAARAIAGARGEAHARELADALYGELYGLDRDASGRRRSLLQYFHGRSKLLTWLRTVLAQRHVDSLRAGRNMDSLDAEVPDSGTGQRRGRTPTALFITSGTSGPSGPSGARETGDPDRAHPPIVCCWRCITLTSRRLHRSHACAGCTKPPCRGNSSAFAANYVKASNAHWRPPPSTLMRRKTVLSYARV
jgi:hypothetical protein